MKKISKRVLSLLLVAAMIFSVLPTVFAAQTEEETHPTESVSLPKRAETNKFTQITSYSDLTDGNYVLLAEAAGSYSEASYYAVQAAKDSTYDSLLCVAADFTSVPNGITATSGLTWTFTYSNNVLTIKNSSGSYLADTSDSSGVGLSLSGSYCTWTPTLYTDGSWSFYSSSNHYLSLRDELEITATNGNPLVCVSSKISVGSCYFYLYRQVESEECNHIYTYLSNGDGTHTVGCANDCGYSKTEDCTMSGGVCVLCDYEETVEYTVEFIVPNGVNAIEPMVGSEIVFPTPSGTPNYNYNHAVFVGWTDSAVDNSVTEPTIYDTSSLYTLTEDLTLYALYAYASGNTFVLFDGSSALTVGQKAIIVAKDYDLALSLTQNSNNRAAEEITKVNNTITLPSGSNVAVLTVEYGINGRTQPSQYSFRDGTGYLTAASSSGNYLRTTQTVDANSTWCYTLDDASFAITITALGAYTRNTIRYNTSALFACYAADNANLKDVQLYVLSGDGSSVYTTVFSDESCLHEYIYISNDDGTHTVTCANNCGYSISEDCSISDGVCSDCGYEESAEYTVSFIVPAGVNAIEPITDLEVVLPVPTGTPDNNTHNATFIGWTTDIVDQETSVPVIYDTATVYTLDCDLTLYALYSYGDSMSFTLYDGSTDLQVGDRVIIVAADFDYAISTTQNNNNRAASPITKADNTITLALNDSVAVFTVDYGVNGADEPSKISLLDDQGYLASASSTGNYLRTAELLSANSTWSYRVDASTYTVTLTSQGTYTRNTIRYNSSSTLFACYAADITTQKDVQLYIQSNDGSSVYTTEFEEACLHEFSYETNSDGTHNVTCINDCGYSAVEDCDLAKGTCPFCGYSETVEFTVTFVVPDGVDAIEPMVGSTMSFPAPTGTPNNNYLNATFVGWCTGKINNSEISPFYYEANVEYDVEYDLTLYALYSYSNSATLFELYDGSYDLEEGSQVIIVAKDYDYAISTTQNSNNRSSAAIIKNSDNTISVSSRDSVAVFTLGWGVDGASDTLSFKDTLGYLRAASSSGNYLRTDETLDASSSWAYVVDSSDYSITLTSQGEYSRNTMRYNKTSSLFACYAADNANQYALQLYILADAGTQVFTTVFNAECPHSDVETTTVAPSCTAAGSVTETCNLCGAIISTNTVAAVGHSYEDVVTAPTCTSGGYTTHTCTYCDDSYTDSYTSAVNHSYNSVVTAPTCTSVGFTTYTCVYCNDSYAADYKPAGDHSYLSEVTTPATCTSNGVLTFTCSGCSNSYTETIVSTGHVYDEGVYTITPTCSTTGVITYTCNGCGTQYTENTPVAEHDYVSTVTPPSCQSQGYTTHVCSMCGDSYIDSYIIIASHNYQETVIPPTCIDGGYTIYACSECGDSYIDQYISATGHSYELIFTAPTCTSKGYTTYTCECGDSFVTDYLPIIAHTYAYADNGDTHVITCSTCTYRVEEMHAWDEGKVITEGTCGVDATTRYTCTVCNTKRDETVPSANHNLAYIPQIPATCVEDGFIAHYECMNCGKYYLDEACTYELPESYVLIPATGTHAITLYPDTAATCTDRGYTMHYGCSDCGKYFSDETCAYELPASYIFIDPLGHNYVYSYTAASHTITCKNGCDYSVNEAHKYEDGVCICGATESTEPVYVLDESLSFSMNISAGAEMQVRYTILNARVSSFESFYLAVTKAVAGGEPVVTTYEVEDMTAYTTPAGAVTAYQATYEGINAKEMGDEFTTVLYAVASDGTIHYSTANTASMKSYLIEKLDAASSSDTLKTMCVDMLNYGAAAQIRLDYDAENLVNADLTEAQLAYATKEIPTAVNGSTSTGNGANLISNVSVQSKVLLYINCIYAGTDTSELKYVVKDAETGETLETLTANKLGTVCQAVYGNVGAKQMRQLITVTLYDGDTAVSQTLTWSVESYVASVRAKANATEAELNMANAMLTYGDSVAAYMLETGQ